MSISGSSLPHNDRKRTIILFLVLTMIFLMFVISDLMIGPVNIPLNKIFGIIFGNTSSNDSWKTIISDFRVPKTLTAILAGTALSISGLQMQTVFRNPLAGPDVLGISAGASLGVALVMLGFGDFFITRNLNYLGSWTQIAAACTGACFVLILVLLVSVRIRDILTILIMGILFGSAASAIVNILQYFSNQSVLKVFMVWSMGSLASLSAIQLRVMAVCVGVGIALTFFTVKMMDVLMLGENYSKSMGININFARVIIFLSTSILSGSVTAFCGPIGFIGIAVPHLARFMFRTSRNKILIPASMLLGSVVLLLADMVSQLPGSGTILPVNTVTALLGIPVVVWVVVQNRKVANV